MEMRTRRRQLMGLLKVVILGLIQGITFRTPVLARPVLAATAHWVINAKAESIMIRLGDTQMRLLGETLNWLEQAVIHTYGEAVLAHMGRVYQDLTDDQPVAFLSTDIANIAACSASSMD